MYLHHNIETDSILKIDKLFARHSLIEQLIKRFTTYGYREVSTALFEKYNLYATMNGTVNHREMIKTIDNTGQVLVLRPDATIPLTNEIAKNFKTLDEHLRYFYVLDVYRQANETKEYSVHTQAGVEFFGDPSFSADAEVIALATHLLQDLHIKRFTIELGHAAFFKKIIKHINLSDEQFITLKQLIQAKNIPDLKVFLSELSLPGDMKEIIATLPFLYGKLEDVLRRTTELPLTEELQHILQELETIYHLLVAYGVTDHIVIDLSLINHMDYYSDMIFQGYVDKVGKPVLMGGRYNRLASEFGANFPAVGFASDIDLLFNGVPEDHLQTIHPVHSTIIYDQNMEQQAIQIAQRLREEGWTIITTRKEADTKVYTKAKSQVFITNEEKVFVRKNKKYSFTSTEELLQRMKESNLEE